MHGARVTPGPFQGVWLVELALREDDERPGSSFREVWQNDLMQRSGAPHFTPIQWNVAVSAKGTLRGIHAEPWHKMVHVIEGEAFAAFRRSATFLPDGRSGLDTGAREPASRLESAVPFR